MNLHLKEKVILVTGGGSGIGEAIVSQLALEGAFPVIIGKNEDENIRALETLQAAGGFGIQIVADLAKPEDCQMAVQKTVDTFGRIHGLVNNAGMNDGVGLTNGSYTAFMDSLHQNVVHYFLMTQHCLPYIKEAKGAILNISSKVAETGQGGTSGYAAANGARNALTREWALELAPSGVRVNAIVVSECWTPMYQTWISSNENPEEALAQVKAKIPLGNRLTTPQEIAAMAVFLLSKQSSHTTGQLVHIDGGYVHLDH
ncbi:MAG: SDR family oxidoreductase [Spirosomataceae bacterium]